MVTINSTSEFNSCEEEKGEVVIVHYEAASKTQGKHIQIIRRPLKVFGFVSTAAWTAAAVAPGFFNVPLHLRPWVFVIFIFWFFGFCAGLFNL